jgi:GTP1/Obg family GTP-binding protein
MIHTHQGYERYARERVREATALYFEWLAQKETRDYDRRQRLSEVARFYRSLAEIIGDRDAKQLLVSRISHTQPRTFEATVPHHRPHEAGVVAETSIALPPEN